MRNFFVSQYLFLIVALVCASRSLSADSRLQVIPASVRLDRPEAIQQLLVMKGGNTTGLDVIRRCKFETTDPQIVEVDGDGRVVPKRDGRAAVVVRFDEVGAEDVAVGFGNVGPCRCVHPVVAGVVVPDVGRVGVGVAGLGDFSEDRPDAVEVVGLGGSDVHRLVSGWGGARSLTW